MPDQITQATEKAITEEVDALIEKKKARRNRREKFKNKINNARKDLTSLFAMGDDAFSKITEQLDDSSPEWLQKTSAFFKEADSVLEKTNIIIGMMKSAKVAFYLALVQVLVEEAKSSLNKQIEYLDQMIGIVRRFKSESKKITDLLSGADNPDALKYAYNEVSLAREALSKGKEKFMVGNRLVRRFTGEAEDHLARAEKRLRDDLRKFNGIPSKEQFHEMSAFITVMYKALIDIASDYATEYAVMWTLIGCIEEIKNTIYRNSDLINKKLTVELIDKLIKSIEKKTEHPLDVTIQKWDRVPPSQSSIAWNEMKYASTINIHRKKIESYFGSDFKNLNNLEIANDSYATMVANLKAEKYILGNGKDRPNDVKRLAIRIGAPSLNVFSLGKKSAAALEALSDRGILEINAIKDGANRTLGILNDYGPYTSALLDYINDSLKALGYKGEPIKNFATGDLFQVPKKSAGIPEVKGVGSSDNTITGGTAWILGKALGKSIEEKTISDTVSRAVQYEKSIKKYTERKNKNNIEQIMADAADESDKEIARLNEEIDIMESGVQGKIPKQWYPDNQGGLA